MSYSLEIGDSEAVALASSRGWPEFCGWVESLPKAESRYPGLLSLCRDGAADGLDEVAAELRAASYYHRPKPDVFATAKNLHAAISGRDPAEVATVTS